MAPKKSDWAEILHGERVRGSGSLAFKRQKQIAMGNACIKYFKAMYRLIREQPREPYTNKKTFDERRVEKNQKTSERRKRRKEYECREALAEAVVATERRGYKKRMKEEGEYLLYNKSEPLVAMTLGPLLTVYCEIT